MAAASRLLLAGILSALPFVARSAPLTFSDATATFAQHFDRLWSPRQMIDGNIVGPLNGWAIFRLENEQQGLDPTLDETALFQLATPLAPGAHRLQFSIIQNYGDWHRLGNFRLGYTTDPSPGLGSADTPLPIASAGAPGIGFSIVGPGHLMASSQGPAAAVYTIVANIDAARPVTGFYLHALNDPTGMQYPTGGPGTYANGNFVVTEFSVSVIPEPNAFATLAIGIPLLGWLSFRNRRNGKSRTCKRGEPATDSGAPQELLTE